ncbi:MAG: hypothetical protein MJE77_18935 [Proteobacteria bacterium]|nr:hypothetical protein [Pseudomonadota bacterium]
MRAERPEIGFSDSEPDEPDAALPLDGPQPFCGDGMVNQDDEECDEGDGQPRDTVDCDRDCTVRRCGDGHINEVAGEQCDPPNELGPCDGTCRIDLSSINQLYCHGPCGNWGGGDGCQQADADALCRLRTDSLFKIAENFDVTNARAEPGICCPPPTLSDPALFGCISLGNMSARGVDLDVSVHNTDLASTHGSNLVVTNVVCGDPVTTTRRRAERIATTPMKAEIR